MSVSEIGSVDVTEDVPKEFDNRAPEDFKDRYPILLARVSTSRQKDSLPRQVQDMKQAIYSFGYRKEPVIVQIQTSGKAADLETLRAVEEQIRKYPRRQFALFVRDTPRFARHTKAALIAVDRFGALGVPVFPLDVGRSPGPTGTTSRMLFEITTAVATGGKAPETDAQQAGVDRRAKEGVVKGVPKDLYAEKMKKGKSLYRQVWSLAPAVEAGTLSQTNGAKSLGLYRQKFMDIIELLNELREKGGPEKVEEFLQVVDAINNAELRKGVGSRARMPASMRTERSRALHRVTVAYLQFPFDYPRPDTVGNPETAEPAFRDRALGTIEDAVANPGYYKPRK